MFVLSAVYNVIERKLLRKRLEKLDSTADSDYLGKGNASTPALWTVVYHTPARITIEDFSFSDHLAKVIFCFLK